MDKYPTVSLRMTLSDLVKYLKTRKIARSLCDMQRDMQLSFFKLIGIVVTNKLL